MADRDDKRTSDEGGAGAEAGQMAEETSPGVRRIQATSKCLEGRHKWMLFASIFLACYCYGLDALLRYAFQNYAAGEWNNHALISTLNVLRAAVSAPLLPPLAKISDYFGRITVLLLSVVLYVLSTVLQAAATNVTTFAVGSTFQQISFSGMLLVVEVIIADTTSLRSRVFFSYIPHAPYLINAWVSADIMEAVILRSTWRWGIGMWGIISPVLTIPLLYVLISAERRAKRNGLLVDIPSPYRALLSPSMWVAFFWTADIIGLILLGGTIALILVPLTLAGGESQAWGTARIITPLVIGAVITLPAFIIWEKNHAPHPLLPFRVLRNLAVCCCMGIGLTMNAAWFTQGDYLFTTLMVSFGTTIKQAAYVSNAYIFSTTLVGMILGLTIRYVRRLKPYIAAGGLMYILAFGLLIRYRGGHTAAELAGLVGAEVVLGIAAALTTYTTQAALHAEVKHERIAVVTALYYSFFTIGNAVGNTIAGAIWTNRMPGLLNDRLTEAGIPNASGIVSQAYGNPLVWIVFNPVGTPARVAVERAYREVQRYLTIAGMGLSVLLFLLTLGLKNRRLSDKQSLDNAEGDSAPDAGSSTRITNTTAPANGNAAECNSMPEKSPRV